MSTLRSLLPAPTRAIVQPMEDDEAPTHAVAPTLREPPSYGQRDGFLPRAMEDFGDGGAFPEIHTLQYPLGMGKKDKSGRSMSSNAVVPLKVDAEGNVKWDLIARQGQRHSKTVYGSYKDLVPKNEREEDLSYPDEETLKETALRTMKALGQIVESKVDAAKPTSIPKQDLNKHEFIRYTPASASAEHNSGSRQRIIRVQEMPVDPLEPPKFKHKKIPNAPPSPPVPVMHSPPRAITAEDQANWKIPPCVSNWKNIKGYTLPLEKRLVADGRGLHRVQISDKFAAFTEALSGAERMSREAIDKRANLMRRVQMQQKEQKEADLAKRAAQARLAGGGFRGGRMGAVDTEAEREVEDYNPTEKPEEGSGSESGSSSDSGSEKDVEGYDEREELRRERRREIRREMRMENRSKSKKAAKGTTRERERDISEKIALGQNAPKSKDSMFDQRLFNQDAGIAADFGADDSYNVYSKPLFNTNTSQYVYRKKNEIDEMAGEDQEQVTSLLEKSTSRFKATKGFEGTEQSEANFRSRDKPVAFEREKEEEDPFGIGENLNNKRNALDSIGSQGALKTAGGGSLTTRDNASKRGERDLDFEESENSRKKRARRDSPGASPPRRRGRSQSRSRSPPRRSRRSRSRSRSRERRRRRRRSPSSSRSRSRSRSRGRQRR